jgi:hypothetical protein
MNILIDKLAGDYRQQFTLWLQRKRRTRKNTTILQQKATRNLVNVVLWSMRGQATKIVLLIGRNNQ